MTLISISFNLTPLLLTKGIIPLQHLQHFTLKLKRPHGTQLRNNPFLLQRDHNTVYNIFFNKFSAAFNSSFPFQNTAVKLPIKTKHNYPWITQEIISACRTKSCLQKKFSKNKCAANKLQYVSFRNKLKSQIRKQQRKYYMYEFNKRKSNCKATWSLINKILNNSTSPQQTDFLIENNILINSPTDIANSFNTYFSTIGVKLANLIPPACPTFESYLPPAPTNSAVFLPTTALEIYNNIIDLNSSSSYGDDEISVTVIKSVADLIAEPLSIIINHSLYSATFPNSLKLAKIIPIFKSGKKSDPANYRPIALLNNFSKIYEKVIHTRMLKFITSQNILYDNQFGFRANYSTEQALVKLLDTIRSAWDNKKYVCSVLIDLKKSV